MTVVPTRTFCCCIPVRAGVVIIALLGLLGGGVLAVAGGLQLHRIDGNKVPAAISITVYALLAVVSALGLVGAIARRISLIKLYFGTLLGHLIFSMGIGGYAIYRVFADSGSYIQECLASDAAASAENPTQLCQDGLKILKGVTVTILIIVWLFEIWGCVIVGNYAKQLSDENAVRGVVKDTEAW